MKTDSRMISRLFFSLLPVQILLVAIGSINGVIDGTIAGAVIGPQAMAVTGLYMPVTKVTETVNAVLLGGSQILCGQFLGKNQIERTKNVFSLDITLISCFALLLTAICMLCPGPIAALLGADAATAQSLKDYIYGISPGILPQMLCAQLTSFLQLEQQKKRTYAGIGAMMAANVALDLLFIKKLALGMFGLGLATSISCWIFFAVLISYYFTPKAVIRFDIRSLLWSDFLPILKIGVPGALVTFCLAARGIIINAQLLACSGSDGVAALAALNTYGYLLYAVTASPPPLGFCAASTSGRRTGPLSRPSSGRRSLRASRSCAARRLPSFCSRTGSRHFSSMIRRATSTS